MKNNVNILLILAVALMVGSCRSSRNVVWLKTAIERSNSQLLAAADTYKDSLKNPRTFEDGVVKLVKPRDWTSGFFPGSLWLQYEFTHNETLKNAAQHYTELLDTMQYYKGTHDLGFILNCSYGNGYRITAESSYKNVMFNGAASLMARYKPQMGVIRSWDANKEVWQYPVIIDNMMNL
ncbi:MAG: hypothetical protein RIS47_461, partial [Bacteroidota bacterium]